MKFLIIFVLTLTSAFALDLQHALAKLETESRITNGQNATDGQFPYQVGLYLIYNEVMTSWCGGSLISPKWILTAAHCTDGIRSMIVYLGSTNRTVAEVTYTLYPNDFLIHAGYNPLTVKNDIALLRIPPVTYSDKIQPILLPKISETYSSYIGKKAVASGWGATAVGGYSNRLQWASLKVIPNRVCDKKYGSFMTSTNLCASTPNAISTCFGDSGGPYVLESSNIQIGVTSFGASEGCLASQPVVFTRVTSYLKWIEANTGISY